MISQHSSPPPDNDQDWTGGSSRTYLEHNINNNNNLLGPAPSYPSNRSHRFSNFQSSPALADSSNTISFATINVRGLNLSSKFDAVLDDLFQENISVIALQETKFTNLTAQCLFKEYCAKSNNTYPYRAYWSFSPSDRAGGVGLIITSFISKYVQRIHRKDSRFIAIDLFLPNQKLKIVNVYGFQRHDFNTSGKDFNNWVIKHLTQAAQNKFEIIVMGDFNTDPTKYIDALTTGRTPKPYYSLTEYLLNNSFDDRHPRDVNDREFATFYNSQRVPTSRVDQIWTSNNLANLGYYFDRVWQLPFTRLNSIQGHDLDHRCIIVYFTKHLLLGELPLHRVKQKGEWRSFFDVKNTSSEEWNNFSDSISNILPIRDNMIDIPPLSPFPYEKKLLNRKWHVFRTTVQEAAKSNIKVKKVSNQLYAQECSDSKLIQLRLDLSALNRIFAFLTNVCFNNNNFVSLQQAQHIWTAQDSPSLFRTLLDINR